MIRLAVVLAALSVAPAVAEPAPVPVGNGLVTLSLLQRLCDSPRHLDQGFCRGYFVGVADTVQRRIGDAAYPPVCLSRFEDAETIETAFLLRWEEAPGGRVPARPWTVATFADLHPCLPSRDGTQPLYEPVLDGLDLHGWCTGERARDRGRCRGALAAYAELMRVDDTDDTGCLPSGRTGRQLAGAVAQTLADAEAGDALFAFLSDPAEVVALRAVETTWRRQAEACNPGVQPAG